MIGETTMWWKFERDEMDLLEQELDSIYQEALQTDERWIEKESELIAEQQQIEHQQECDDLFSFECHEREKETEFTDRKANSTYDPMYSAIVFWAMQVFSFAQTRYQHHPSSHLFRILLNVYLVPLKYAIGLQHTGSDDAFASLMADRQYELALCYLKRTLSSLTFYQRTDRDHIIHRFLKQGRTFKRHIQSMHTLFHRRSGGLNTQSL